MRNYQLKEVIDYEIKYQIFLSNYNFYALFVVCIEYFEIPVNVGNGESKLPALTESKPY